MHTNIYKHIRTHTPKSTEVFFSVNMHSVAKPNLKKEKNKHQNKIHTHTWGGGKVGQEK